MDFICCCRKLSSLKKDSRMVKYNEVSKDNVDNLDNVNKNRTCNIFIKGIKRSNSNLSNKSVNSNLSNKSVKSEFSSDTISVCSNSSLNDYIVALDSIMTKQEYMNPSSPPVCGHQIEKIIFNTNLL